MQNDSKRAVLLFGGYNPFTNAHLLLGKLARETFPGSSVIYVPAKQRYFDSWKGLDSSEVFSQYERLELIRGAIWGLDDLFVSSCELDNPNLGRTYDTVNYFKKVLGYSEVVLCFGTDKVQELERWYMGKELIAENSFLIVTRAGQKLSDVMTEYDMSFKENFTELSADANPALIEYADISATKVRSALKEGDLDYLKWAVPEFVYNRLIAKP